MQNAENRRLNILFITKWYPSEIHTKSGIFVEEYAKAVGRQHNVTVLFAYPAPKGTKGFYAIEERQEGNLRVIKIKYKPSFPLPGILEALLFNWWIKYIYRKVLARDYQPDIVHAHVYRAGPSALAIGKMANAPVILSAHSFELLSQKELTPEFRLFANHVLKKFSRILPVSRSLADAIRQFAPQTKINIIPNVVNTDLFYPENSDPHAPKRILTVSLLTYIKGIPDLLRAIRLVSRNRQDFILDIVGDGPERNKLEQLTDDLNIRKFVRFHGMKSKEAVAEFMRRCDFFTLPSHMETFGCVFIEAMACGKPIVATRVGNIPDLVKEDNGILVPPADPPALCRAIEDMLDNYPNYPSQKIVEYVRKTFSYAAIAEQLDNIYQEELNKK